MKKGQKATFALLVLLLQTGASFDLTQRRHPRKTMALQVTRVEQAIGNGLRRLYRLPKRKRGLFALFGR